MCTWPTPADVSGAERLLEPLLSLHDRVRTAVLEACSRQAVEQLAAVASDGDHGGDTIYAVDRVAEETFARGLAGPPRAGGGHPPPPPPRVGAGGARDGRR